MPVVAYGTFRSAGNKVGPAVFEAIKAGYRHFDLAHVYGNEKEIGGVSSTRASAVPLACRTTQARVPISCNQIETHAYYERASLVNYCLLRGICVTAHTPLGGGAANKEAWGTPQPLEDPVVQDIASSHSKSPAQVLLKWLLQRGVVVLPKSVKPDRIRENLDLLGFQLTEDEMKKISALDKYVSYKTNPNPLESFLGAPDAFTPNGTDIFG